MPLTVLNRPDPDAMNELLNYCYDSMVGVALRLAWYMGLIASEIANVKWEAFDWQKSELHVGNRTIPVSREQLYFFDAIYHEREAKPTDYVVVSSNTRRPVTRQSISRAAREAMDSYNMTSVRLVDLRHDFILRQLEQKDWSTVSRIAGVELRTLKECYDFNPESGKSLHKVESEDLEVDKKIDAIIDRRTMSPAETAIMLSWYVGLSREEIVALTWDKVDLDKGMISGHMGDHSKRAVNYLMELKKRHPKCLDCNVIVGKRTEQEIDPDLLSKQVKALLVRSGIDHLTLRSLCRNDRVVNPREEEIAAILVRERSALMEELQLQLGANAKIIRSSLHRMMEAGRVTKIGRRYYLSEETVSKDTYRELLTQYLLEHEKARRGELATLLNLNPKQCLHALEGFIRDGWLIRVGKTYSLK